MNRSQAEQRAHSLRVLGRIDHPAVVAAYEHEGAVAAYRAKREVHKSLAASYLAIGVVLLAISMAFDVVGLELIGIAGFVFLIMSLFQWVLGKDNPYELARAQDLDRAHGRRRAD